LKISEAKPARTQSPKTLVAKNKKGLKYLPIRLKDEKNKSK